jgi:serine/threonine protein phosphatase PrpC
MKRNVDKEEVTINEGSKIYKGAKTIQLDKGQDHVDQGHYIKSDGQRVDWVVALDGHGNNSCINVVRKANMSEIMATDNPAQELQKLIDADKTPDHMKLQSGATFICAKMSETTECTTLDISYAGDSIAVVILNGKHIFTTEPHTLKHSKQMMRLIKKGIVSASDPIIIQNNAFDLVNADTLISKRGEYIKLLTSQEPRGYLEMAPSNSIGHNGLYGSLDIDTASFKFKKTDTVRVVLMSDGVSDIVDDRDTIFIEAESATNIVQYAHERWKQKWNYLVGGNYSYVRQTKFPANGYDDCCVAMIECKSYVAPEPVIEVQQVELEVQEVMESLKDSV